MWILEKGWVSASKPCAYPVLSGLPCNLLHSIKLCAQYGILEHLRVGCRRRNSSGALGSNQDSHLVCRHRAVAMACAPKDLFSQSKPYCLTGLGQSCAMEQEVECTWMNFLPPGGLSPYSVTRVHYDHKHLQFIPELFCNHTSTGKLLKWPDQKCLNPQCS